MNKSIKIGVVVIGLLVVIAITHTMTDSTLQDLAPKKETPAPEPVDHDHGEQGSVQLPDPMGPADALVKVNVYVTSDNDCDTTTLDKMKELADKYGDKIHVSFGDLLDETVLQEAQIAKIGCKSGLTIDGKSKFVLPERGLKGAILLDGPVGQTNYTLKDVEDIIAHLLQKKGVLDGKSALEGDEADAKKESSPEEPDPTQTNPR